MKFTDDQKMILTVLLWNTSGVVWQTIDKKTGDWHRKYPLVAVQSLCDHGIIRSVCEGEGDNIRCVMRYTRKGWDMMPEIKKILGRE